MNMTTFDIDFGATINQIYKQKIDSRSSSETIARMKSSKLQNNVLNDKESSQKLQPSLQNERELNVKSDKTLGRSETVPTLLQEKNTSVDSISKLFNF